MGVRSVHSVHHTLHSGPCLMSPHDLLRPLSEYRATNNLTTRQLWRMWRPELRAIVVHMFLFPPSPLLLDGFICNFSPPSAGPSPVLVPAWAYPDGWVNNVHFCIQVMLQYVIHYILQHTKSYISKILTSLSSMQWLSMHVSLYCVCVHNCGLGWSGPHPCTS